MTIEEEAERAHLASILDQLICIAIVFDREPEQQRRARAQTANERRAELVQRVRRSLAVPREGNRSRSKAA